MITESVRGPGSYLRLPRRAGWTTPCRWCCAVALESNQVSWAVVPQKWRPAFSAAGPLPCWYRMNAASPERCRFGRCPSCHCTLRPCKGCGDPPERIVSARRQSRTGEASSSEPGSRGVTAGFFDQYPRFYETSETFAYPSRLNLRHEAIFAENTDIFEGRRVLDIASHGGRWSFAALPWRGPRLVIELRRPLGEPLGIGERSPQPVRHQDDSLCRDPGARAFVLPPPMTLRIHAARTAAPPPPGGSRPISARTKQGKRAGSRPEAALTSRVGLARQHAIGRVQTDGR